MIPRTRSYSSESLDPKVKHYSRMNVKRSLLTERGYGVPIGVAVDGANRHDMKLVRATMENIVMERPEPTQRRQPLSRLRWLPTGLLRRLSGV